MDEEGSATQRTELIREGVLTACLHNRETALRGKTRSTGNGVRSSLSTTPAVGPMQVQLLPGSQTPEALYQAYPDALVAADVLGLHTLDPVTGDFSLGASGWLLQPGGDVAVRGVTLSGNLMTWLKQIVAVGSDVRVLGHFSAPSVVVRDLLVAGE
jgi:PmbA protein